MVRRVAQRPVSNHEAPLAQRPSGPPSCFETLASLAPQHEGGARPRRIRVNAAIGRLELRDFNGLPATSAADHGFCGVVKSLFLSAPKPSFSPKRWRDGRVRLFDAEDWRTWVQ